MFNKLTALGLGIVTFAIVLGVGTVVLTRFGDSTATCAAGVGTYTYNATTQLCSNTTDTATPTGPWVTTNYLGGQLGTSGLAGWAPAIIALAVGLLFLGAFMTKKGKSY